MSRRKKNRAGLDYDGKYKYAGRKIESSMGQTPGGREGSHGGDQDTGDDEVAEVVQRPPPDLDGEGDVQVRSGTALVENFIPFCGNR